VEVNPFDTTEHPPPRCDSHAPVALLIPFLTELGSDILRALMQCEAECQLCRL